MRHPMVLAVLTLAAGALLAAGPAGRDLDMAVATDRALAFQLTRGSTDPSAEVFFHWTGTIHAQVPADPFAEPRRVFTPPILRFEGFNVARFLPGDEPDTTVMLSRELGLYMDPETGAVLDCWDNPYTGERVTVLPVLNDPVNLVLGDAVPAVLGDERVWTFEIPLAYPSPLPLDEFGPYSAGNTYESIEVFDFVASAADLADPALTSVPATLAWTRVGPWLPWMRMGQRPGRLVYHATGHKLPGGWGDLPSHLRQYVDEHAPTFAHPPQGDTGEPNATSWSVFRERLEAGEFEPICPDHAPPPALVR